MKLEDIPAPWRAFLLYMRSTAFPEAVIAGGALRDIDNGVEPKDVDVFVTSTKDVYEKLCRVYGEPRVTSGLPEYVGWNKLTGDLGGLFRVGMPSGRTFEVIATKVEVTPRSAALRNDFGFCQIATDGEGVFKSPNYLLDQSNRTFTLVNCLDAAAHERSVRRFRRISQRYPGWRFVDKQEED